MGYKRLKISKNKTRDEHRVLMEQALGRTLDRLEHVHHKDGNKRNNALENLEVLSAKEHLQLHRKEHRRVEWTKEMRAEYSRKFSRERHPQSKVTPEMAAAIKARIAEGKRNVEIAKEFRISRPLVSQIRHGKRWS